MARRVPPFRVQQTEGYLVIIVDVPRVREGSMVLNVAKRFFSVRFSALAAEGEVHYELRSELGLAAEGHRVTAVGSRVRVASLNMTVALAKAPSAAADLGMWAEQALPTERSAQVSLAAVLKSEAKQATESTAAEMTVRTWRLRTADLGICSDAPLGARASLQHAAGDGAGVMPASPGALVPSLRSLFPTDASVLSRLQRVCARGCGLIDTDIQALCACLRKDGAGGLAGCGGACPELTSLELSFNQLSFAAVAVLAELLRLPCHNLKRIDLGYNHIGQHVLDGPETHRRVAKLRTQLAHGSAAPYAGAGDDEGQAGGGAAAKGAVLEWLSLAGNELCAVSLGACLSLLCPSAGGLELDCSNCGLSADDLPLLVTLELGALRFDDNVLGDAGLAQIARPLASGGSGGWGALRMLSLRNVSAGDHGVQQLAAALEHCALSSATAGGARGRLNLRTLDLRDNRKLSGAAQAALQRAAAKLTLLETRM